MQQRSMPSIFRTRVRSPASGFGRAAEFNSPVRVPTLSRFLASLEVSARVSNPRSIALSTYKSSSRQ